MNRIKRIFVSLMLAAGLGMFALAPATVYAATSQQTACNAITGGTTGSCTDTTGSTNITTLIKIVINLFSLVVGVVAVIMIIVGGFKYVTSNGDSNATQSARNTILYAIVGLVIVAMAQFIVMFVLDKVNATPKAMVMPYGAAQQFGVAAGGYYVLN